MWGIDGRNDSVRADRLLALLLLLQRRGRMTAAELAAELEVCERTIYRDVEALSSGGVPIYGERGPDGGYALLDGYRTSLTGLTGDEMRAFFMLSIPAPLADLGVSQELKAALLKVSAALPASQRGDEEKVRQRFYIDPAPWHRVAGPVPHLNLVHQAVWNDRRLQISYRTLQDIVIEQLVDAYGLVAKVGIWYLVYALQGHVRVLRVANLDSVTLCGDRFERPSAFDLLQFWQAWCAEADRVRASYPVTLRVSPRFIRFLPRYFGEQGRVALAGAALPDASGWRTMELQFERLEDARERVLSCGAAVEVVAPEALRVSVADYGAQIVMLYTH